MEQIMFTMLMVVPGALVEVIYRIIAPQRHSDKSESENLNLALYVTNSLIVVFISIAIFTLFINPKPESVYDMLTIIGSGWNPLGMACVVLMVSILYALLWWQCIDRISNWIGNKFNKGVPRNSSAKSVWSEILTNTQRYDWDDVYAVICKGGEPVRSGAIGAMPENMENENAIALYMTEWMTGFLAIAADDDPRRGHVMTEYFMLNNDYSIKFYKSPELFKHIGEMATSQKASAEVEACLLAEE